MFLTVLLTARLMVFNQHANCSGNSSGVNPKSKLIYVRGAISPNSRWGSQRRRLDLNSSSLSCVTTQCMFMLSNTASESASSHCVFWSAPQIRHCKDEACKMQLVLCLLFEVQGDPSSCCSYLDTH